MLLSVPPRLIALLLMLVSPSLLDLLLLLLVLLLTGYTTLYATSLHVAAMRVWGFCFPSPWWHDTKTAAIAVAAAAASAAAVAAAAAGPAHCLPPRHPRPILPSSLLLLLLLLFAFLVWNQRFLRQYQAGFHEAHMQRVPLLRVALNTRIALGRRFQRRSRRRLRQRC